MCLGVVVDAKQVQRIAKIASAQATGGELSRPDIDSIFDVLKVAPAEQEAVMLELERYGTRVSKTPAPSAVAREGELVADHPVVSLEGPVRAAREVISHDRRSGRPWNRLLKAHEEVGMAALIRGEGVQLDQDLPAGYCASLPESDERSIAFNAFMLHNVGLVRSIAMKHVVEGLEEEDIEHYGMIGLVRAVEKFDASKGLKFSTYATWWIKQAIQRGIANDAKLIRIPVHMAERIAKVVRARDRLHALYGKSSFKEIAVESGMSVDQVVECLRLNAGVVSLDKHVDEEGGGSLGDFIIEDPDLATDPGQLLDAETLRSIINDALATLSARESEILKRRHGMVTSMPQTLDEIGAYFGLTRERIRQLEVKATAGLLVALEERGVRPSRSDIPPAKRKKGVGKEGKKSKSL
jgi:RNA polymerase primary sigma factor